MPLTGIDTPHALSLKGETIFKLSVCFPLRQIPNMGQLPMEMKITLGLFLKRKLLLTV